MTKISVDSKSAAFYTLSLLEMRKSLFMKKKYLSLLFLITFVFSTITLQAAGIRPKTKPCLSEEADKAYMLARFNAGAHYYNAENWRKASNEFEKLIYFFPASETAAEASFYLGICYYEMNELDFANTEFSAYLKTTSHPEFFEQAIFYKYWIAEKLKTSKRRPFKYRYLPKWLPGQSLALEVYDEIVMTVPNHELAVCALFSKAELLQKMREYRESIETYQTLIRRFPRHELTPDSYLRISQAYYQLSQIEFQNPDLLGLAELNARKFKEDFPRDERVETAEKYSLLITEVYAQGLCSVGQFYERTHHPEAAAIYYQSAIEDYPNTKVAAYCRCRLNHLNYNEDEEEPQAPPLDEEQAPSGPIMLDPQKGYEVKELPDTEFH